MKILVYIVTYKYNAGDPQSEERCYTPGAARALIANVELWGGVAVVTESEEEEEGNPSGIQ